jgi:bifunctional DNase/RNase
VLVERREDGDELFDAEISTVGWDRMSRAPVVLLRVPESSKVVPIWVGLAEARAIAAGLQGEEFLRPLTHDLMANLLARLDVTLEEIIIHDVRDGVYYGLLKLQVADEENPRLVDTRPSDGLALAVRTGASILVSKKVLDDQPEFSFSAPEGGDQVVQAAGLTVVAVSAELRREFGLPDRPGVVVLDSEGEAQRQGLKRGDLIVDINGTAPSKPIDFLDTVLGSSADTPLRITYWREGEEHQIELVPDSVIPTDAEDKPKVEA